MGLHDDAFDLKPRLPPLVAAADMAEVANLHSPAGHSRSLYISAIACLISITENPCFSRYDSFFAGPNLVYKVTWSHSEMGSQA